MAIEFELKYSAEPEAQAAIFEAYPGEYQVFEMENVWRPDEIIVQEAERESLLALTKEEKDYQIKVPKVL